MKDRYVGPIIAVVVAISLLLFGVYAWSYHARTRSVSEHVLARKRLFDTRWEVICFTPISKLEEAYIGREVELYDIETRE